jgi:hypothetical protein
MLAEHTVTGTAVLLPLINLNRTPLGFESNHILRNLHISKCRKRKGTSMTGVVCASGSFAIS